MRVSISISYDGFVLCALAIRIDTIRVARGPDNPGPAPLGSAEQISYFSCKMCWAGLNSSFRHGWGRPDMAQPGSLTIWLSLFCIGIVRPIFGDVS